MLKHYKVRSPLAILFPVFIETYHYRRSTYAAPPIRSLAHWNVYIGITGTPILPSYPYPPPSSQTRIYEMFYMTSPLEGLRLLQKIELPSRLSNLYASLMASLKEKMSLICHTAMKRGRPSSWVWQWRERKGERLRGRCMRV